MIFDLIRASAALMVLFGHAFAIFPQSFGPLEWPQQIGVVIFFLLSGYLISQTLHRRLLDPNSTFLDYAIDRWSRIYSGFLPALLLVAMLDYYSISHYPGTSSETVARFTLPEFLANASMLQAPAVILPFGSAAPFWTVAIEFWIYMFVGLLAFAIRDGLTVPVIIGIVLSGLIPIQSLTENNVVLVPWLLGAGSEQLIASKTIRLIPKWAFWSAGIGSLIWLAVQIWGGQPIYSYPVFFLSAATLAAFLALWDRTKPTPPAILNDGVKWWADWSYSLYLLHHSILMFSATAFNGTYRMLVGIIGSIIVSIVFAKFTEAHHRRLAAYLKALARRRLCHSVSMFREPR
ncbi:acyltransferase [Bradyrhizobium lablabi]|uniref:acyltransferase family protein n=1 Tax=Bradyrhizobium lablabi TaxID=722472 RepID=UPI001BA9CB09|nr:acyltransferase [Bradyrhizobium lablabi]MBR0696531.1 acyltransferase [Bradyrhizobium lablabi]